MTMRLTIKNEDTNRTATIEVVDFNPADEVGSAAPSPATTEVPPGETREVWIHSGRKAVLREKQ
jgi:hypothetical protein